ncbi:conserved hypothetical protein [Candidatus Sulfopaludibacter sp. SbA6]|nr:conserved hypothetical protein [Candidatus Sulfopaludibacter sp. SbA6]
MAISTPGRPRNRRFQLRVTASEETLIKVAAERQGVNVTDFIMRSACEKAEQALSDQTRFALDDKQWKAFLAALDRPSTGRRRTNPASAAYSGNSMSPSAGHERFPESGIRNREVGPPPRPHAIRLREYNAQFVVRQIRLDESAGRLRQDVRGTDWGSCCRLLCANDRLRPQTREPEAHRQGFGESPNRYRAPSPIGRGQDPAGQGTRQGTSIRRPDPNRRSSGHCGGPGCHGSRSR